MKIVRELHYARRGHPGQFLRLHEDEAGWVYIAEYKGEAEHGPYQLEELIAEYELESAPVRVFAVPTQEIGDSLRQSGKS